MCCNCNQLLLQGEIKKNASFNNDAPSTQLKVHSVYIRDWLESCNSISPPTTWPPPKYEIRWFVSNHVHMSLGGAGADRCMVQWGGTGSWLPQGGPAVSGVACLPAHKKPPEQRDVGPGHPALTALGRDGRGKSSLLNYQWHWKLWRRAGISDGLRLLVTHTLAFCLSVRYASPWSRSESLQSTKMFWLRRYKMKTISSRISCNA